MSERFRATRECLEREEREVRGSSVQSVTPAEVVADRSNLQALFAKAEPVTRHRIMQAWFDQVEVLGPTRAGPDKPALDESGRAAKLR